MLRFNRAVAGVKGPTCSLSRQAGQCAGDNERAGSLAKLDNALFTWPGTAGEVWIRHAFKVACPSVITALFDQAKLAELDLLKGGGIDARPEDVATCGTCILIPVRSAVPGCFDRTDDDLGGSVNE